MRPIASVTAAAEAQSAEARRLSDVTREFEAVFVKQGDAVVIVTVYLAGRER